MKEDDKSYWTWKKSVKRKQNKEIKEISNNNRMGSRSAGRGTGIINKLEDKASAPVYLKTNKPVVTNPLREKLDSLLKKFPENGFYLSLSKWKGSFTPKQTESIERNYEKYCLAEPA